MAPQSRRLIVHKDITVQMAPDSPPNSHVSQAPLTTRPRNLLKLPASSALRENIVRGQDASIQMTRVILGSTVRADRGATDPGILEHPTIAEPRAPVTRVTQTSSASAPRGTRLQVITPSPLSPPSPRCKHFHMGTARLHRGQFEGANIANLFLGGGDSFLLKENPGHSKY